jgi:polyferredoxin
MMYQHGLMSTYREAWRRRGASAWILGAAILAFYLATYFTDWFDPLAAALGLGNKWWLYGAIYSLAMIAGGAFFLGRHGNSRYQRVRTLVVVAVQIVLAFCLPFAMALFGKKDFFFSYLWPLKTEYFYPSTILEYPVLIALYSFIGSLILFPALAFIFGKRFYCSWICGCGGLAETAGDSWRHLSDKSTRAWKFEQISIHTVLLLALGTTAVVFINWGIGQNHPGFAAVAFKIQEMYGLIVGALLSGVFAVALYPLLGTRVWCRFFCPMAALLGLIQKFGRFRISVKPDMCISCGNCSAYCEMGIDVRAYARNNQDVKRASCVGCGMCAHVCPRGVLKLESKSDLLGDKLAQRLRVVDL